MPTIHSAVDAYSRVAYSEIHYVENQITCCAFPCDGHTPGSPTTASTIERVLTDNGPTGYRSFARDLCAELGVTHTRTGPYHPATNGKVERFNRTLLDEWAYVRVYRSDTARNRALDRWLHLYNHHRAHTAIGGHAPMELVNNLPGHYN